MAWGYRSKVSHSRGGTSAWNTAGETASIKNACAQYGLTEEQVATADPPIKCQWRSCHGNSYAVVKLDDMAALRNRLRQQAIEAKKQALIDELGEEGYNAKVKADAAAAVAKRQREDAARSLVSTLEASIAASGSGIAPTLDGMTISKTAAKKEWDVKPDELESLSPVDPSKKLAKYHLADVIRLAHDKRMWGNKMHICARVKAFPARQKLYARFLHNIFLEQRSVAETLDDDGLIIKVAYDTVRGSIYKAVKSRAELVKSAQAELAVEENRLAAFDDLVKGMGTDDNGNDKNKQLVAPVSAKMVDATSSSTGADENTENNSKKPAAKKRKVATKKKGLSSDAEVAVTEKSGTPRSSRSRRNTEPVLYAEE